MMYIYTQGNICKIEGGIQMTSLHKVTSMIHTREESLRQKKFLKRQDSSTTEMLYCQNYRLYNCNYYEKHWTITTLVFERPNINKS